MPSALYIVLFAFDRWWIDLEGKATGPFADVDTAAARAMFMAEDVAAEGRRSEVRIAGPGYNNRIVFRSDEAAALATH